MNICEDGGNACTYGLNTEMQPIDYVIRNISRVCTTHKHIPNAVCKRYG